MLVSLLSQDKNEVTYNTIGPRNMDEFESSSNNKNCWYERPLLVIVGMVLMCLLSASKSYFDFLPVQPALTNQFPKCDQNTTMILATEEIELAKEEKNLAADAAELSRLHKILSRERIERCKNVDWIDACERIGQAGARRRGRKLQDDKVLFNYKEEQLLDSDDPSVVYDENCLRLYRLDLEGDLTFPYHANKLLRVGGNQTMALFIQHGAKRDSEHYFCSFAKLMMEQAYRPFKDIIVIAPNFEYKGDNEVYPYDAFWNSTKPWGDWRVGAQSDPECCGNKKGVANPKTVSSFDILDHMLAMLTDRDLYPNMNKISILGHSAGGQMVQRYALTSLLASAYDQDEIDWIDMQFIVANPSSYTYLDERRFSYNCGHCSCDSNNCTCPKSCTKPKLKLSQPTRKGVGQAKWPCYASDYNSWPYGLTNISDPKHMVPYVIKSGPHRAAKMYSRRNMVYLVGQNDTCNDGLPVCDKRCWKRNSYLEEEWPCYRNHMDTRCPAMLQGPYRRLRGEQYMKYLETYYGKPTHNLYTIHGVGHDATGIFGSDVGLEVIFS